MYLAFLKILNAFLKQICHWQLKDYILSLKTKIMRRRQGKGGKMKANVKDKRYIKQKIYKESKEGKGGIVKEVEEK